jgi:hypothetical protein
MSEQNTNKYRVYGIAYVSLGMKAASVVVSATSMTKAFDIANDIPNFTANENVVPELVQENNVENN